MEAVSLLLVLSSPATRASSISRRTFSNAALCAGLLPRQSARAEGATQYSTAEDLLAYVREFAIEGDGASVVAAIDSFSSPESENRIDGWGRWMMNVGPAKGDVLEALVREKKPSSVLEVGTFAGYSALRMIRALPAETTFVTIEKDPRSAAVAQAMFDFAGVPRGRIDLVVGSSSERFADVKRKYARPFDVVLFDHWKPEYAPDVLKLEKLRMLRSGSVLVCDNVICPGAPGLLKYMGVAPWPGWDLECDANFLRTHSERRDVYQTSKWVTHLVEVPFEYRPDQPDAMSVSVFK